MVVKSLILSFWVMTTCSLESGYQQFVANTGSGYRDFNNKNYIIHWGSKCPQWLLTSTRQWQELQKQIIPSIHIYISQSKNISSVFGNWFLNHHWLKFKMWFLPNTNTHYCCYTNINIFSTMTNKNHFTTSAIPTPEMLCIQNIWDTSQKPNNNTQTQTKLALHLWCWF
jgi:hypothetical protein